jgi:hypothetical protein
LNDKQRHMRLKMLGSLLLKFFLCMQILLGQQCVDKQATRETRDLFNNLYKLQGKNILFGHQDDPCYGVGWKYIDGKSDIKDLTGQFPAVYGFDLGRIELGHLYNLDSVPFEKTKQYIQEAYERGGIITLSWHLNNPLTGGTAWDNKTGAVRAILPGGEKNQLYREWLDRVAAFIGDLRGKNDEPIPVILRLFHELNGDWFWWGKDQCTSAEMREIFQFSVNYLRNEKKMHNLLFAYNTDKFYSGKEYLERYPGDEWIDILGFDIYQAGTLKENDVFSSLMKDDLRLLDSISAAHQKIPALTEFGYHSIPDSNWWSGVFLPDVSSSRIVYALAWRNAGRMADGSLSYYAPYLGAPSSDNFKVMVLSNKLIFEDKLKAKNIYR